MTNSTALKTSVCILGSGPAGIVVGNILLQNGIDCIIADRYNREEIYTRARAGVLESTTVDLLKKHGLADTIFQNGYTHDTCEFRYPDYSVVFDYGKLADGDVHYIYPQSDLNDDLIQRYLDAGGKLLLRHEGKKITQTDDGVIVECYDKDSDTTITIHADFVAGCDGYHGLSRQSIPDGAVDIYTKQHPYGWLAVLAYAPPSAKHVIYGLHHDGFGAHMPRNTKISRYYLQVSLDDELKNWPDQRIWTTLAKRLAKKGWTLKEGEIFDKRILSMRSYVMEPLQYQRLLIAGDAGHIITPCGGKGLNLAVQDAGVLGEVLVSYYQEKRDISYLKRYSEIRLPYIWRAQEFSCSMLHMLHKSEEKDVDNVRFFNKLSESKLKQLSTSVTFARDFARNYVGII
ncbi:FAD-dependent oxidoreductase [Moorena producens PAL-8-15-08-1]|uniref:FAD-dependent oxidoreductase n=1 Tax=Moorena producens PAL-8-15-08-1 TaxID=1458985 RepID=A0A1D8TR42_9CYAN|nr:4-hydroxybenzoate 3-monooxygenase [Moorena producens]AOX00044.1 FAD-dependent oxidoreductase [Moorena producens PAL-8-15-08-1]